MSSLILSINDEDDFTDALRRNLAEVAPTARVISVKAPAEAQWYLLGMGRYTDRERYPLPSVVSGKIQMRGLSGQRFLEWLRARSKFDHIQLWLFGDPDQFRKVPGITPDSSDALIPSPRSDEQWQQLLRRLITVGLVEAAS
jgi:hypothetical protein